MHPRQELQKYAQTSLRLENVASGGTFPDDATIHSQQAEKSFEESMYLLQVAALGPILGTSRAANSSEFPIPLAP
jgi:hypothetical protein